MADAKLCKNDIAAVFKRLRGIPSNKVCFDCGAKNPTWASVTYGVFICMDCSAVHRSLGVHLSFVRSTQLDTNWTWLQLRAMQIGGNSNALSFFQQHGCTSKDAQQKYNSRAAQLYREKLHQQAAAAMRLHGTKLHIEAVQHLEQPSSPEHKDEDFFKDHLNSKNTASGENFQNGSSVITNNNSDNNNKENDYKVDSELCPKMDELLNVNASDTHKTETYKSSITGRKIIASKRTGAGGKKGLGAQKVAANFSDIEKEAQKADELRQQLAVNAEAPTKAALTPAEEEKQQASIRLAYKDISQRQKETEEKLRQADPRKAEQLERLGMGFGTRSGFAAHSASSEMKVITQENVATPKTHDLEREDDFEFFEFYSFTSGPPKYGDSPFLSRSSSDRLVDIGSKDSWSQERKTDMLASSIKDSSERKSSIPQPVLSDEAQRKFGNAKAISSQQYFGSSQDAEFERRANLTRFEGSNSISSEDFFGGDSSSARNSNMSSFSSPNLYDIKEGVRDGVTKVAGRLSSLANGMMNSLQRK